MTGLPPVTDRTAFEAELGALRTREKAHTREGDAIAAARRRLPMTEVDASLPLDGPGGPVTLLDAFEGRRQLVAYYFMWHRGHPAPEQCEGCTWVTSHVREVSYLHSQDITYAVLCQGPYAESARYRDFMGWTVPWYSAEKSRDILLTGRQAGRRSAPSPAPPAAPPTGRRNGPAGVLSPSGRAWRPATPTTWPARAEAGGPRRPGGRV